MAYKQRRNLTQSQYIRLHQKVRRIKGKASFCENDSSHESKWFEWAWIGDDYMDDFSKFKSLCLSCHRKLDVTQEFREFRRKCALGNKWNNEPIIQLSIKGVLLSKFGSLKEASQVVGVSRTAIGNNLNNRSKSAGGFVWRYQNV